MKLCKKGEWQSASPHPLDTFTFIPLLFSNTGSGRKIDRHRTGGEGAGPGSPNPSEHFAAHSSS